MSIYHVIGFTFDMKILNYLLETNTYRSASQIYLGVLTCVILEGFGSQVMPDTLQASLLHYQLQ